MTQTTFTTTAAQHQAAVEAERLAATMEFRIERRSEGEVFWTTVAEGIEACIVHTIMEALQEAEVGAEFVALATEVEL